MLKSVLPERVTECSPEQARALVSVTRELLATVSEDGDFLFVNESFTRVLGYSAAELIGRPLTYLHPPAEASFVREKFASILREDAATVSYTEVTATRQMAQMRYAPGALCCTAPLPAVRLQLHS